MEIATTAAEEAEPEIAKSLQSAFINSKLKL